MREEKNHMLQTQTKPISFLPGAEHFLEYLIEHGVNFVIVTNTSRQNVQYFQKKLPTLAKCTQWITREDVTNPKPHPEPYRVAKERYFKDEPYIVGIENTVQGYKSLSDVTKCIYIVTHSTSPVYTALQDKDVYFIKDVSDIYTRVPK